MQDQSFPLISYERNQSSYQWGLSHGEQFRDGIKELFEIRKTLMLEKNPQLKTELTRLAEEQWISSKEFAPEIAEELKGISIGSNLSIEDIIILNNYTDFRDIVLDDQGCSTVAFKPENSSIIAGQTWDMHSSAKNYVCVLKTPLNDHHEALVFSLVGCVGMMGVSTKNTFVGVNNINTQHARPGLIWPLLVRKLLECSSHDTIEENLINSPVTSGHNYLIADKNIASHWEVTPTVQARVSSTRNTTKAVFHTNHCLDENVISIEIPSSSSSTTQDRFGILKKYEDSLKNFNDLDNLLNSHENYPKSICCHFESGSQDPSMTCGGGIFDMESNNVKMWRGCKEHDSNYKEYNWTLKGSSFEQQ